VSRSRPSFPRDVVAQPLERLRAPFDSPEWVFELKYDGFRGLAYLAAGDGVLVSRKAIRMRRFAGLAGDVAMKLASHAAILDGEIACIGPDGAPSFHDLMFRRAAPIYFAFDLLWLDGQDLRRLPLATRKSRLRLLLGRPRTGPIRYVDAVVGAGVALFDKACRRDLEGIVAKWAEAPYGLLDGRSSWVKIKNGDYSGARDRHEPFAR
jgi:bifunctional non-homologous end joining protein LigD